MALSWNDLSDREKQDLARQYEIDKCYSIDYSKYNATPENVRRMVRRYMQDTTHSPATYTPIDTAIDDTRRWQQTLSNLAQKQRFLRVIHPSDIHTPYHDENALNLAYKLVAHVQPHIIVVGSDFADFELLSSFTIDPDAVESEDQLEQFESYWNPHIHALHAAAPNAAMVWICGNHEARIIKYIIRNAPGVRNTIMKKFVEIIRCGGRVQFIGEVDRVQIGDTLVLHGNRYGVYPARGLLDDVGYQCNVMAGHNHKLSYFEKRGALYTVKGIVGGCLCEVEPHYIRAGALRAKWQHGTVVADIDMQDHASAFHNLEFVADTDGQLMARLGLTTIK